MLPNMHYGLLFFGLQVRIISEFAVYGVFTYLEVWVVNFYNLFVIFMLVLNSS